MAEKLNSPNESLDSLLRALKKKKLPLHNEYEMQRALEAFFTDVGVSYQREKRLSESDRPDFILSLGDNRIAVECKIKTTSYEVFKQVERYLSSDQIDGAILISRQLVQIPELINGKPCYFIHASRASL